MYKKDIQTNKLFWQKMVGSNNILTGFFSIFEAIQEGIIIADIHGCVNYVNSAYTKITGVKQENRVGKMIHEVSPGCPLAQALETRMPVTGVRYKLVDSNTEALCNAAPIFVDDEMIGGVVIFQDITEVINLSKKLEQSNQTIKLLNKKLSKIMPAKFSFNDIVGGKNSLLKCVNMAKRASQTDCTVLLTGESGTGKELFAHAIHNSSNRSNMPFVKVNCAAIPENLLESEFFGFEKGAFTGANKKKVGLFELADGGTIFLDEIGEMNLQLQAKILRVLEEGDIQRIGSVTPIHVDVRIISATNRNLYELVKQNKFRSDLFYRLNVVNIEIPPLRERINDIIPLADHLLRNAARRVGKNIKGFSSDAYDVLKSYHWPGNVRELRNCIERAVIMTEGNILTEKELQFIVNPKYGRKDVDQIIPLHLIEKEMITKALLKYGNSLQGKKSAAKALGISLRTLYNKIKRYDLNP